MNILIQFYLFPKVSHLCVLANNFCVFIFESISVYLVYKSVENVNLYTKVILANQKKKIKNPR